MHTFVVYAPDKTDEGAYERRLSVRAKHLENFAIKKAEGLKSSKSATVSRERERNDVMMMCSQFLEVLCFPQNRSLVVKRRWWGV